MDPMPSPAAGWRLREDLLMPQGDDFIMDIPVTPAPAPVDPAPAAPTSRPEVPPTSRTEVGDPATSAPVDPAPAPVTPDETPDAAAQRRRDAAFAAQRRENQALKARLDAL